MEKTALHMITPVLENRLLGRSIGRRVLFKMECFQPSGSFKLRGIGHLCRQYVENGATHLISSSGGNAGYAVAYAGARLGARVTVVVPETSSPRAMELIESEGAELVVFGKAWDEAHDHAISLQKKNKTAYIPPFDHPGLWEGHSTMIDEIADQCGQPDAIVLSVGGGGLLCGVMQGIKKHGWSDVPVIAAETLGAHSFFESVSKGKLTRLERITSISATLGAKQVTPKALEWTKHHKIIPVTVTDKAAVSACLNFANDMRVLVEPACGASLSIVYDNAQALGSAKTVLVIACGGIGTNLARLEKWKRDFGL